jgi:hypothetical protein
MATGYGSNLAEVQHLQNIAWQTFGTATVDGAERDHYWRAWTRHCCLYPQNDCGVGLSPHNIDDMLLTFAVVLQEGQFGLSRQIKV